MSDQGDWDKLAQYLLKFEIALSDHQIRSITGSTEKKCPLPTSNEMKQVVEKAGYEVGFCDAHKTIKIFTRIRN